MKKILIVDDDRYPGFFYGYSEFFIDSEVHHALYIENFKSHTKSEILSNREDVTSQFLKLTHVKSSKVYTHSEMIEYLRGNADNFDKIVLDGLTEKCFALIKEVPLDLAKTVICSGSKFIIDTSKKLNYPYIQK